MTKIIPGKTLFDLDDDLDMNNDSLELLIDALYEGEGHVPAGFIALLNHVHSNYKEVGKGLGALRKV